MSRLVYDALSRLTYADNGDLDLNQNPPWIVPQAGVPLRMLQWLLGVIAKTVTIQLPPAVHRGGRAVP